MTMIRPLSLLFMALGLELTATAQPPAPVLPYQNPLLTPAERTADLLGRMTLDEKVGQMTCLMGWDSYHIDGAHVGTTEQFRQQIDQRHVGHYWATFRADPWTRKTIANGLDPRRAAMAANAMQRYAIGHSRLGIPLFLAEEAPHGHMAIGATVFPTGLGLAATFDTALVACVGAAVAREIRLQGGHVSYGPVIDLAREPRWSRVEETFGEDHVLTAQMAAAMVRGTGGGRLAQPFATISTLKHFVAYGVPEGGHNGGPAHVGQHELHEQFLPPFREAIAAGARSVMTAYNAIDGRPSTAHDGLLRDVLRRQWQFQGLVVSDLYSIDGLRGTHHVAPTLRQAAAMAVGAGVDIDLGGNAYARLAEAVEQGETDTTLINEAVARVLMAKFEMGLFDHPYVDPEAAARGVGSAGHVALAREAARESIVLLKNDGLLPLGRHQRVAVVGPNAHQVYNLLGDYTAPQPDGRVSTVLSGIRQKLPADQVRYARGCAVRDTTVTDLDEALRVAEWADVVVAVVGGSSARDFRTTYEATGAAAVGQSAPSDMECGEGFDRATLALMGHQQRLLSVLKSTGKPLVVVYVEGRPLLKNWAAREADALLTAFYPGQEGGNAVADVLFGDYNPAGRLAISVPRSEGQLPVYYNHAPAARNTYTDAEATPLYAFGHGLSYTSFQYSDLQTAEAADGGFDVRFTLTNTGRLDGDEVPQLYLHPQWAPVVQPLRQLRHFARVHLKAGASTTVVFHLPPADFEVVDASLRRVPLSGPIDVMVGAASDHILLHDVIHFPGKTGNPGKSGKTGNP